jgi:hypothetical protein
MAQACGPTSPAHSSSRECVQLERSCALMGSALSVSGRREGETSLFCMRHTTTTPVPIPGCSQDVPYTPHVMHVHADHQQQGITIAIRLTSAYPLTCLFPILLKHESCLYVIRTADGGNCLRTFPPPPSPIQPPGTFAPPPPPPSPAATIVQTNTAPAANPPSIQLATTNLLSAVCVARCICDAGKGLALCCGMHSSRCSGHSLAWKALPACQLDC